MTQEEKKKPRVERGNGGKLQKTLAEVFTCQGVARGDNCSTHWIQSDLFLCFFTGKGEHWFTLFEIRIGVCICPL